MPATADALEINGEILFVTRSRNASARQPSVSDAHSLLDVSTLLEKNSAKSEATYKPSDGETRVWLSQHEHRVDRTKS